MPQHTTGRAAPASSGRPRRLLAADPPFRVGQIEGLRPRRRPGREGDVPAADVHVVDELDLVTLPVVTAWLLDKPSLPLRRTRLRVLASYLRWLRSANPAADLLAAEHQVDSYCLAALTTGLPPSGKPLAKATVIRRGAVLASFYAFARQARATPPPHHGNAVRPPSPAERHLIRAGAAHLAREGRLAAATAVALLEATGTTVTALARLTARDICLVGGIELALVTLHDDRDDLVAFPLSPHLRALAGKLCGDRPDGGPLITKDDGAQVDLEWMRDALTSAALAAGLHPQRARHLHPHLLRARTAADVIDRPARPS